MRDATKVGDTETAIVDPADATNVVYEWFMGDSAAQVETAIEGADADSLKITEALVGKFIKVNVTGENGSSASATTEAPVAAAATDKIAIASAKQIGASKIEVTFNKPISTSEWDIAVSRGSTAQTITTVLDESAMVATITLGTAISTADYTVKVTNKKDATETASSTVKGEMAALQSIGFLGDQLILMDSTLKKAKATLVGYNQFDEKVALTGSLTLTSTKGTAKYNQADTSVEVTCGDSIFFTVGESVTITGVYTAGTTILQVSKALTVSNVATVTEFELGEIATTKKELKGAPINLKNLATDSYYFPVKVAKDQYENDLSATTLDTMMIKANENDPTAEGYGNFYITPNQSTGSYAYVTGFTELEDGTIAMNISKGDLDSPGTAVFALTGVSGFQGTQELTIVDDPFIDSLAISAPTFYSAKEDEFTVTATDQYGQAIDLYEFTDAQPVADDEYAFTDKNHMTKGSTTLKVSSGAIKVKKNTSKQTVSFVYVPDVVTKATNVNVTVQTATPMASILTWNVQTTPELAGIKSFDDDTTVYEDDVISTGNANNFTWLDGNGATASAADYPVSWVAAAPASLDSGAGPDAVYYVYTVKATGNAFTVNNTTGHLVATDDASKNSSSTITVTLYKVENAGGKRTVSTLKAFTFKAYVFDGNVKSYTASLAKGDELLYVNKNSNDSTGFSVNKVDDNGTAIAENGYTVTVDGDLPVAGQRVSGRVDGISGADSATATIWVNGKAEATVKVPYDTADPKAQTVKTYNSADKEVTKDEFEGVTAVMVNGSSVSVTDADDTYTMGIEDQYGLWMSNTKFNIGGSPIEKKAYPAWSYADLTATSAKVAGTWLLSSTIPVTPYIVSTANVINEAALTSALAGSTDIIFITKDIALTGALTIPTGKTVYVNNGVTLDDGGQGITNNGYLCVNGGLITTGAIANSDDIEVEGTWDHTGGAINNTGYVYGYGHVNLNGCAVSGGGDWNVGGYTLVLNGVTFNDGAFLGGRIELIGNIDFDGNEIELLDGTILDVSNAGNITGNNNFTIVADATVTIITNTGKTEMVTPSDAGKAAENVSITKGGAAGDDINVTETVKDDFTVTATYSKITYGTDGTVKVAIDDEDPTIDTGSVALYDDMTQTASVVNSIEEDVADGKATLTVTAGTDAGTYYVGYDDGYDITFSKTAVTVSPLEVAATDLTSGTDAITLNEGGKVKKATSDYVTLNFTDSTVFGDNEIDAVYLVIAGETPTVLNLVKATAGQYDASEAATAAGPWTIAPTEYALDGVYVVVEAKGNYTGTLYGTLTGVTSGSTIAWGDTVPTQTTKTPIATTATVTLDDTEDAVATTSEGTITWASMATIGAGTVKVQSSTDTTDGKNGTWNDVAAAGITWAQTGNGSATTAAIAGGDAPTTQIVATLDMTRGTYYRLVATPESTDVYEAVTTTGAQFGYLTAPTTLTLTSVGTADGAIAGSVATGLADETPAGTAALYETTEIQGTAGTADIVAAATLVACNDLTFEAATSNTSSLKGTAAITAGSATGNYLLVFTTTAGIYGKNAAAIYSAVETAA